VHLVVSFGFVVFDLGMVVLLFEFALYALSKGLTDIGAKHYSAC